ncbi:tRNA (guanosine(37)-N1)-methyltransferase TrmD [Ectothiorhodospiraceae bacterium BW-2]|nr:tRNA (guanosine(37)-N1)-methyltransferase TrmD [Ectothiorhodospiraceae bacterium BW-2]
MRFDIVTLFPQMFAAVTESGITARALQRQLCECHLWNPRDFTTDRHRTVDDRPYGGGPGMVMRIEPLQRAIQAARAAVVTEQTLVVALSPQGERLTQQRVAQLCRYPQLILVAGRYEGIDERLLQLEIDCELSLGDYVLSGGELAVMVVMDAIIRLLPGALGHEESAAQDSFSEGLLDYPHYTRPDSYQGLTVPPVLRGGNHQEIARWRLQQSLLRTSVRRPDLLQQRSLSLEEQQLLQQTDKKG